ncbi:MAG: 50S ribosomal protein L20 [Candidatus Omnitrophica bacterium]|nr:50S ribosomal protein L20 [Candidatus Omnitrophota bacterium]
MPRTTGSVAARKRRKKVLKTAKGARGGRSKLYRTAKETVDRALAYATRDRRVKKRVFRNLWVIRINAAVTRLGFSYNRFINGLKKANIILDRKILAEIAVKDKEAFKELVELAKQTLLSGV